MTLSANYHDRIELVAMDFLGNVGKGRMFSYINYRRTSDFSQENCSRTEGMSGFIGSFMQIVRRTANRWITTGAFPYPHSFHVQSVFVTATGRHATSTSTNNPSTFILQYKL